jgi:hypothetical protein
LSSSLLAALLNLGNAFGKLFFRPVKYPLTGFQKLFAGLHYLFSYRPIRVLLVIW